MFLLQIAESKLLPRMADKKASETGSKTELGLLEEDDEFEEFPQDDWDARKEDSGDGQMWEVSGIQYFCSSRN